MAKRADEGTLARSSGPVLFTETVDGVFRIWGCVIDEPDFFSLWTSLDVHTALPKQVPLATSYWRTKATEAGKGTPRGGTEDEFVTVFIDGSVHLTTVSNFDCRPPACLVQSTSTLQQHVFSPTQLANFRHTYLLPSRSSTNTFHLVGRCARSTLVHARATVPSSALVAASTKQHAFHDEARKPPVSVVGRIIQVRPALEGGAVLAVGEGGRVQSWTLGENEGVAESFVAEAGISQGALVATWLDGASHFPRVRDPDEEEPDPSSLARRPHDHRRLRPQAQHLQVPSHRPTAPHDDYLPPLDHAQPLLRRRPHLLRRPSPARLALDHGHGRPRRRLRARLGLRPHAQGALAHRRDAPRARYVVVDEHHQARRAAPAGRGRGRRGRARRDRRAGDDAQVGDAVERTGRVVGARWRGQDGLEQD